MNDGLTQIIVEKTNTRFVNSDPLRMWMRGNIRCDRCKHSGVGGTTHRLFCDSPNLEPTYVARDHYCKEFTR